MGNAPQYCLHWMWATPSAPPVEGHCYILNSLAKKVLIIIGFVTSRNHHYFPCFPPSFLVGGRHEALRPWQRSWGRRLDIRKGGIEPQESPWKSSSIYPHNQSLPTLLLCALTYTSDFTGGCPPPPLSEKELT